MKELIKIETREDGIKAVSARALHESLKAEGIRFSRWFEMYVLKYGFIEGQDFTSVQTCTVVNNGANKPIIDYALTLDVAKHVCMLQRSELGMKFRQYFIECEKELRKVKPSYLIEDSIARAEAWIIEQKEKQALQLENKQQQQIIGELKPKATYYDLVLQSTGLTPISLIAKDYGMSAVNLNKRLHEFGVQYKQSDTWLLYAKYQDKGYTQSKTQTYQKGDGTTGTRLHTQWTQKGRLFLYDLLKQNDILPVIER